MEGEDYRLLLESAEIVSSLEHSSTYLAIANIFS